jgi:protein gp37
MNATKIEKTLLQEEYLFGGIFINATKIEYLHFTWSPNVGCSGQDCAVYAYCFAKAFKKRKLLKCPLCYEFKPHNHFERLEQPLQTKISRRIGVDFSGDFWDREFSMNDQMPVLNIAAQAPQHWFINLTKQPQNIPDNLVFPKNWVQGVSVNRRPELWRVGELQNTLAETKMISFEPLYENIGEVDLRGIDWIIIGAQTHPTVEPKNAWVIGILAQAQALNIPVFTKNNLPEWRLKEYPAKLTTKP